MATFKICVFEHQKREDGKYPISIRITNNRKSVYVTTGNYVTRSQISRDFSTIKDTFVARSIDRQIQKYEEIITSQLGADVNSYSAHELSEFLKKHTSGNEFIKFTDFAKEHIANIRKDKSRESYAKKIESTMNALTDYFGRDSIYILEITSNSLYRFAEYLKSERNLTRKNRAGGKTATVVTTRPAVSDRTVSDYMTNIRTLFNAAIDKYNDDDLGVVRITHYPFRKFKIKGKFQSKNRNLSSSDIKKIREATDDDLKTKRAILGRDVFLLSFYLAGTNLADLYYAESYANGRISYNRRKTRGRRTDDAYISIHVEPEVLHLLKKYRDKSRKRIFRFYKLYGSHSDFAKNVNAGLKQLCASIGLNVPVTSYFARHSWATIARNECGVSKDDINLALNHVDTEKSTTDIYIAKDWSIIDKANRKVIDTILK